MELNLHVFLLANSMDKRKNAFCDVPVIPTDRIDVLGIHIVDSNLTCRYRSIFLYNRIVQIRDICTVPEYAFRS